ncbi:late competence development ComFB family protein [Ectobacillus panaciterrae]|uniref:late competence development ComFB family protein n=1 Tax=Ectobacillus panaciterrae TaxID=363872 RepID=UPI00041B191F|nr:late competence development ComFB family protein [Ectobacillus panaciterrae]
MKVTNIMEPIVMELFKEFRGYEKLKCDCDECINDILALTLNRIPPKYSSTRRGAMMIMASYTNVQLKQDILNQIALAAMQVRHNPGHNLSQTQ